MHSPTAQPQPGRSAGARPGSSPAGLGCCFPAAAPGTRKRPRWPPPHPVTANTFSLVSICCCRHLCHVPIMPGTCQRPRWPPPYPAAAHAVNEASSWVCGSVLSCSSGQDMIAPSLAPAAPCTGTCCQASGPPARFMVPKHGAFLALQPQSLMSSQLSLTWEGISLAFLALSTALTLQYASYGVRASHADVPAWAAWTSDQQLPERLSHPTERWPSCHAACKQHTHADQAARSGAGSKAAGMARS